MVCRSGFENDPLEIMRHSAAHIMADAVTKLFPTAKPTIGPVIENGFFYDFDYSQGFTDDDLVRIEDEMKRIIKASLKFVCKEISRDEAISFFEKRGDHYKIEIINELPADAKITLYQHGDFIDLCRGPHVQNTSEIGVFKLLSVAGAYWRGKEGNPQLQRIYGTAFFKQKDLEVYLKQVEEAKKRDHRKLGQELDLFSTSDMVGPGLVLWHPLGARIRHVIETYWCNKHYQNGYELVYTPHIGRAQLWQTSGHLEFYHGAMYAPMEIDKSNYYVRPMNCPFHIEIYQTAARSYRDLPLRWAELGTVYRYEKSGVLHGLLRVRGFTQDDAHIICTPEQVEDEIARVVRFSLNVWKDFGFEDVKAYLATRPADAVGEPARWDQAICSLKKAVDTVGLVCEVEEGGGAFYGPKIDLRVKDAIGREWQTSTIQFDFNLPERFDMTYVGDDGQKHRPYMVHRALFGSLERFFGILVEHYAGAFPFWLAPTQIRVLSIIDEVLPYAQDVVTQLRQKNYRVELDNRNEKIGFKIRDAQIKKIPYMLVIGKKEMDAKQVAVRHRKDGDLGVKTVEEFLEMVRHEI